MRPPLVILCGGKGTRLGVLTKNIPKPMVDVCGKPFLYWLIQHYINQGFSDITLSVSYKEEVIRKYPWPWLLRIRTDHPPGNYEHLYDCGICRHRWIVNGDTWIEDALPATTVPVVLIANNTDAGAHFVEYGKVKIHPCASFWDIGTPESLQGFKTAFKAHRIYLTHLAKQKKSG